MGREPAWGSGRQGSRGCPGPGPGAPREVRTGCVRPRKEREGEACVLQRDLFPALAPAKLKACFRQETTGPYVGSWGWWPRTMRMAFLA